MKKVELKKYQHRKKNWIGLILWFPSSYIFFESRFPWPILFKRLILSIYGAKIGKNIILKPNVKIKFPWQLQVGDNSWIGEGVWINNISQVKIGDNCCLSQGVYIETGNHDYKSSSFDLITSSVKIGDGSWFGAKSIVCPGVTAGNHTVLCAGSVLTTNSKPFGIYQGNPASLKRTRALSQRK